MNDFADLVVDARWNRDLALYPGHVRNDWKIDGREKVSVEASAFGVSPGKTFILNRHEMVHEGELIGRKEVTVNLVECVATVGRVAISGLERRRTG